MSSEKLAELKRDADNALESADKISASLKQPWSPELVQFLGVSLLVFAIIVLLIAAFLLRDKVGEGFIVLKIFGIVLIVCMSAFLMIVGYGHDQLTPIVGLFGAIAGYLLGKDKKD